MTKAIFVPAMGEQLIHAWSRKLVYNGFDLKWFTPQSHFVTEASLICCYYPLDRNGVTDFRTEIDYPKDKILVTDSAGFQVATFKQLGKPLNITPLDSLRWQEANADIAMNLDVPLNFDGTRDYKDCMKCLNQSVENFTLFEKEKEKIIK